MNKQRFTKGDTIPVGEDGKFEAGIHDHEGDTHGRKEAQTWWQRVVVYGETADEASALRDEILAALSEREDLRAQLEAANETIRRNEGRRLFELCVQHGAQPGHVLDWLRDQLQARQIPEGFVLVPVDRLKHVRRDLDACQRVIWYAGGFDPAYCTDAQARLAELDIWIAAAPKGDSHE